MYTDNLKTTNKNNKQKQKQKQKQMTLCYRAGETPEDWTIATTAMEPTLVGGAETIKTNKYEIKEKSFHSGRDISPRAWGPINPNQVHEEVTKIFEVNPCCKGISYNMRTNKLYPHSNIINSRIICNDNKEEKGKSTNRWKWHTLYIRRS